MTNFKSNIEPITLTCIHCHYIWEYRGRNLNNVCCPKCKMRSNHNKGKSLLMDNYTNKLLDLEQRVDYIEQLLSKTDKE